MTEAACAAAIAEHPELIADHVRAMVTAARSIVQNELQRDWVVLSEIFIFWRYGAIGPFAEGHLAFQLIFVRRPMQKLPPEIIWMVCHDFLVPGGAKPFWVKGGGVWRNPALILYSFERPKHIQGEADFQARMERIHKQQAQLEVLRVRRSLKHSVFLGIWPK